ncbi:hypothetical protein SAMN04487936_102146 [Halobacillus dabanensis]|uniref:Uncharacterized protein n=1 Tax=Halobacillus dabanensis TaxID=240302 RepID=A0A1I3RDF0_HALDA|nr:hypothetical protein [Halobacillus dabanensis]SFJ43226.1 hypothetical protein SAMN04487936_102146 [Halobacillus dabanensis]
MIEVLLDHSYEDDYFMISDVTVNIKDSQEKERVKELVEKHNLVGWLVDVDRGLSKRLANLLQVDAELIDFDTNDIDIM